MENRLNVYPILLAGGSGTRLWPVSRQRYPKQLVKFIGEDSLIQSTIKRMTPTLNMDNIRIVCGKDHVDEIARQLKEIEIQVENKILAEPCGRNTAPAIVLAMLQVIKQEKDAVLCVFPADHVIRDNRLFHERLESAVKLAEMGYIVTFGITPNYPETGYGYIEGADEIAFKALSVKRFVEKPDLKTAKEYINAGNYFWNSGMFTFKASVMMQEIDVHYPGLLHKMKKLPMKGTQVSLKDYQKLPNISIDYAVMEKTGKAAVLPSEFGWSDIGSWKSLYDFIPKDANGNVIKGDVIQESTQNSLIMAHDRLIATNKIKNMVVIETPDVVFVSDLEDSRDVKSIVEKLKEIEKKEYQKYKISSHLWGNLTVLEATPDFSVEKRDIYPGSTCEIKTDGSTFSRLIVIKGTAELTTRNQSRLFSTGESFVLPESQNFFLKNNGKESLIVVDVKINTILTEQFFNSFNDV
jgi:mannose-1-phosphate guanylyltransferase/mannose-6-phosphate isomerase